MTTVTSSSRYRHVHGGLDAAVKYAEERGLHDLFIVDVDCHQGEPFTLFSKYLPEKYRRKYSNRKLLAASRDEDGGDYGGGAPLNRVNRFGNLYSAINYDRGVGGRIRRPEVSTNKQPGSDSAVVYDQSREEVIDTFSRRMQDIGIKRCIVFPNTLFGIGNNPDHELEVALNTAYNDYMLDNYLDKYPEILSCIALPANSPTKSAEMIDRLGSEKGFVAVSITPGRPSVAGDDSWHPIYEAAERRNLPVLFHGETTRAPPLDLFKPGFYLPVHAIGFPLSLIVQLTSLVVSAVPERFPKLKFGFIEGGLTWVPWMMRRLDSEYMMRRSEAPELRRLPSEYIKQFYFSQQPLEFMTPSKEMESLFRAINADTQLMYASDYPHWDFDAPSCIYDLPFLSKEEKKNILGENAAKLFRLKR